MFVALDKEGNRLYADAEKKYQECFCPVCNEEVTHKLGKGMRRPHFAHQSNSVCTFGLDKDYKSEWHIRMQEYFPKEAREYRFKDEKTGEVHIADVFIKEKGIVLEFQHSTISEEEFVSRTAFHLNNGRKIVWLFDESTAAQENQSYGRFKEEYAGMPWPYEEKSYRWLRNPRVVLNSGPDINTRFLDYSVCVYTGTEGDVFHRIVLQKCNYQYVAFSLHDIEMGVEMDAVDFFRSEQYWASQEPWKSRIAKYNQYIAERKRAEYLANQFPIVIYKRPVKRRRRF